MGYPDREITRILPVRGRALTGYLVGNDMSPNS